jgi:hypothetical protein
MIPQDQTSVLCDHAFLKWASGLRYVRELIFLVDGLLTVDGIMSTGKKRQDESHLLEPQPANLTMRSRTFSFGLEWSNPPSATFSIFRSERMQVIA